MSDCIEKMPNKWKDITAIALTVKPGLEPCLWEGIQFSKLLLKKYSIPFIPIHHMEAHALISSMFNKKITYPFLALLISGGHCLLAICHSEMKFERLGESIDMAPGNFIDKMARKMGLFTEENSLSGGRLIELKSLSGDPNSYPHLIRAVQNYNKQNKNCDFSFSGFQSAMHRLIDQQLKKNNGKIDTANLCATVQHLIALQLEDRLKRALLFCKDLNIKHCVIAGGVAANLYIKSYLTNVCSEFNIQTAIIPVEYCTDNGVMIAWNGVLVIFLIIFKIFATKLFSFQTTYSLMF